MSDSNLLTISNWAKRMDVTTSYVYKLIKDGVLVPEIMDGVKFVDLGKYCEIPKKVKI